MNNLVIIPTYNERANIKQIITAVFGAVAGISILIVDDNSPDGTQFIVKEMQAQFPNLFLLCRRKKEGLGKAYIHAFQHALVNMSADTVIIMDADLSHDPRYLPYFLNEAANFDVVVGSRYIAGGRTEGWELWRRILSKYGNWYAKTIIGLPVSDCTAGFNLIKTEFLKKVDWMRMDSSGYAFQIELKYLLWQAGARFKEMPIVFKNRRGGESKISGHIISEGVFAPWKIKLRKQA